MSTVATVLSSRLPFDSAVNSRWRAPAMPFNSRPEGALYVKGMRDVLWSSIVMILLTPIGSRIMNPEFGSLLPELVFEANDDILAGQVEEYVVSAISRWEPRVRIISSDVARDGRLQNALLISITYEIVAEGVRETKNLAVSRGGGFGLETR